METRCPRIILCVVMNHLTVATLREIDNGRYCCLKDQSHMLLLPALKYEFEVSFRRRNLTYNGTSLSNNYNTSPQNLEMALLPFSYIAIYSRCGYHLNVGIPKLHWIDSILDNIVQLKYHCKVYIVLVGNAHTHGGDRITCPQLFRMMGDHIEKTFNLTVYTLGDHDIFAGIHCLIITTPTDIHH